MKTKQNQKHKNMNLHDLGIGKDFLKMTQQVLSIKRENSHISFVNRRDTSSLRNTFKETKR